jgi:hypothetical protein
MWLTPSFPLPLDTANQRGVPRAPSHNPNHMWRPDLHRGKPANRKRRILDSGIQAEIVARAKSNKACRQHPKVCCQDGSARGITYAEQWRLLYLPMRYRRKN